MSSASPGSTGARLALGLMLVALAGGLVWRFEKQAQARENARAPTAPPAQRVVKVQAASAQLTVTLPGTLRPRNQVTLYARTNGFLRTQSVDLGDPVHKGQVLARVEAPEVTANLAQTKARLGQAERSLALVQGQHERALKLSKTGNLSTQELDASALHLAAAEAELESARAEVQRLEALVGFQTIRAPFEGVITKRYFDDGALVSSERTALFDLGSTSDLRLEVDVPQWIAAQVKPGTKARVAVGRDDFSLEAKVSRTAGTLDPVLRVLHVELLLAGKPKGLVAGSYAKARFDVPRGDAALQLPGGVLVVRGGATQVALVQADGLVKFVPARVLRDLGRDVELLADLPPEARVALYPPAQLSDGDRVAPIEGKP